MANVLIANPPTLTASGKFNRPIRFPTFNYATPVLHPPLMLAYAASYLSRRGHDVTFVDAQVDAIPVDRFVAQVCEVAPEYVILETSTPSWSILGRRPRPGDALSVSPNGSATRRL